MKNIKIIIGSNFGDEGKGLMTDYFSCLYSDGIVVRFNGGAQAGHTVATPDGKRHIFGHFSSGTLCGLPTYLSSHFVVNPITFHKELSLIHTLGINPLVYVDADCMVTTPYDMIINQASEIFRGSSKHGSCGLGFNETITRSLSDGEFCILVSDLFDEALLRKKLNKIKDAYMQKRLQDLGIFSLPEPFFRLINEGGLIESYIIDIKNMLSAIKLSDTNILHSFNTIIFEGAQGLLLDQNHSYFPHVTRSNTGIKNAADIIKQLGYHNENIEIVYVTRAYMTRHGAGPFPTEVPKKPYEKIKDLTNVPNPFQDSLRYGYLDLNELANSINHDLRYAEVLNYKKGLAITCLDQLDDTIDYFINRKKVKSDISAFTKNALAYVRADHGYLSYGETRNNITII